MTFRNINRLFVLSFRNGNNDPVINSFYNYYMPLVETKEFKVLIDKNFNVLNDNKPFFDQPVKNKQKVYEKLIEMSKNDDYTTGNLLHYLYHQNYHKLFLYLLVWFLNTLILQEKHFYRKAFLLKSSKKIF